MSAAPADAIRELTEGDSLYRLLTNKIETESGERREGDDDLRGQSIANSMVLTAVVIALAAERGPEFVGSVQKVLAKLDESVGNHLRARLSREAVRALTMGTKTADKTLSLVKAETARQQLVESLKGGGGD